MTDTQSIKDKLDIAQVIGEYISLKKAGVYFKACCPFHKEKTPSLMIHQDRQFWHCFGCFPKGVLIQTEDGLKPIEEIKKGDYVYTHKGNKEKVIRLLGRTYQGLMRTVYTRKSNLPITLTNDHEVFYISTKNCTQKSRKSRLCQKQCRQNCPHKFFKNYKIEKGPAKSLEKGDYLLYPVNRNIKDFKRIKLSDYLTRDKKKFGKQISKLPENIFLNDNFLKLLGYWIAEGSNHRAYIRFSVGDHEVDFANEISELCDKVFSIPASIYRRSKNIKKSGTEITCCNSNLANIFENLCGKGAGNKHIPYGWELLPLSKQRMLLEAIFRGDGHTSKGGTKSRQGYRSITTISHQLAFQLKNILLRLGIAPSFFYKKPRIDSHGINHKGAYHVMWYEDVQATYTDWMESGGVLYAIYPINKIVNNNFKGTVYNFTVAEDHSYLTENFAVGNCGKGGDVFSFVQEIEGLEFPETLRLLADKAGVKLEGFKHEIDKSQKNRLLDVNAKATYFFHRLLLDMAQSQDARDYLEHRGLKKETIEKWEIGYVTEQWELLTQYLLKKGVGVDDLVASGLTIKKDHTSAGRGIYDRFRGRIMFPIRDVHGAIVGFTGRQLVDNPDAGGKYVNTPQTLVYDKSRVLYGLYQAKTAIKEKDLTVIVEGQMDVIACHQAGMTNVVAASGTALTVEQVRLLKRYSTNLAIAFDADKAGINAAKRGIDVALVEGLNVKVIQIPDGAGKDADECLKKNPVVWFKAVESATDVMQWFFDLTLKGRNMNGPKEQQAVSNELLPLVSLIPYAVERDFWMKKLADEIGTEVAVLREDLQRLKKMNPMVRKTEVEKTAAKPVTETVGRLEKLLERFLLLVVKFPEILTKLAKTMPVLQKEVTPYSHLYFALKARYNEGVDNSPALALEVFGVEEFMAMTDVLRLQSEMEFADWQVDGAVVEAKNILLDLKEEWAKRQRHEISQAMALAEQSGDQAKIAELLQQFQSL